MCVDMSGEGGVFTLFFVIASLFPVPQISFDSHRMSLPLPTGRLKLWPPVWTTPASAWVIWEPAYLGLEAKTIDSKLISLPQVFL